ncbi:Alpha/Beta hydrolase protein [Apodospora peruviana]|uniref:Alpha/Beta hydrolase protein n=1 Tax=Apodospora peruviana TaxID=516989 RepID=A0AAE0ID24_9PEZI|nr:Alpha/Beta hydrolase protein [Apodospora peruviana]
MVATKISTIDADGVQIFYRSAGPATAPTIVLQHGFPSSSHMFRNLIPLLATRYRVIAPDLPGFGFTQVPADRNYKYTFASLTQTFTAFVDALKLTSFAVYIFDYGAPTALRFALQRPDSIAAIISQNGNAYEDCIDKNVWAPFAKLWVNNPAQTDRDAAEDFALGLPFTLFQYQDGSPHPQDIPPEALYLDQALLERPGNKATQLDLLTDYQTNIALYPEFHEYFRSHPELPVLTAWGKNDKIFIAPGAEAFKRDVKNLETKWLDAGHFALETNEAQMAEGIFDFLEKYNVFKD